MKNKKIKTFTFKRSEIPECLVDIISGKVFHLTPYNNYHSICKSENIETNVEKKYECHFSDNSYGRNTGKVCLFDFRDHIEMIFDDRWQFVFDLENCENKYTMFFLKEHCYDSLETYSDYLKLNSEYKQIIPFIESWYTGPISINDIDEIIHIKVLKKNIFERELSEEEISKLPSDNPIVLARNAYKKRLAFENVNINTLEL